MLLGLAACDSIRSPSDSGLLDGDELTQAQIRAREGDDAALDSLQMHFQAKADRANQEKWIAIGVKSGSIKYRLLNFEKLLTHVSITPALSSFDRYCASLAIINDSFRIYVQAKTDADRRSAIDLHMRGTNLALRSIQGLPVEGDIAASCVSKANLPSKDLLEF
jgi:hypothetical protein